MIEALCMLSGAAFMAFAKMPPGQEGGDWRLGALVVAVFSAAVAVVLSANGVP